jgi:endonuclease YncB( thermonuclease family)
VIDAETIVIEVDGVRQTVRYLGIDAPTGDDCFAEEATEANRSLVEGQTVRIERQATDTDAQGNWVRDVWVTAEDGSQVLVSEALVAEGAATSGISEPNTRFAGWILGSESVAQAEGTGLWAACEEEGETTAPDTTGAILSPVSPLQVDSRLGYR